MLTKRRYRDMGYPTLRPVRRGEGARTADEGGPETTASNVMLNEQTVYRRGEYFRGE